MHPDVHTMEAHAWIDERLREATHARLVAQARAGRRHLRQQQRLSGVSA